MSFVETVDRVVWFIAFWPQPVLYVNPFFKTVWGIEREELFVNPRLWVAHIHPDDRIRVERAFAEWARSVAHESYELEYRVVHKDQSIRTVRDVVSGLFGVKGNWCGSTGVLEDITQQKRCRKQT